MKDNYTQASKIVSTATHPAGQVTWKSTCPAAKPTCPAFLYDNDFSQLTNYFSPKPQYITFADSVNCFIADKPECNINFWSDCVYLP